jgi:hypothetical protein
MGVRWPPLLQGYFGRNVADLGGFDCLSEAQKQHCRGVALMSWECERLEARSIVGEAIDLEQFGQLTDRIGRACQRLGLRLYSALPARGGRYAAGWPRLAARLSSTDIGSLPAKP